MNIPDKNIAQALQFHCAMVADESSLADGSAGALSTILGLSESALHAYAKAVIYDKGIDRLHWGVTIQERYKRAMSRTPQGSR